jgi:hypothetical protein
MNTLNTDHYKHMAICFISRTRYITVTSLDRVKTSTFVVFKDPKLRRSLVKLIIHLPHTEQRTATLLLRRYCPQQTAIGYQPHTTGLVLKFGCRVYERVQYYLNRKIQNYNLHV